MEIGKVANAFSVAVLIICTKYVSIASSADLQTTKWHRQVGHLVHLVHSNSSLEWTARRLKD
jgi:hypothetical protein